MQKHSTADEVFEELENSIGEFTSTYLELQDELKIDRSKLIAVNAKIAKNRRSEREAMNCLKASASTDTLKGTALMMSCFYQNKEKKLMKEKQELKSEIERKENEKKERFRKARKISTTWIEYMNGDGVNGSPTKSILDSNARSRAAVLVQSGCRARKMEIPENISGPCDSSNSEAKDKLVHTSSPETNKVKGQEVKSKVSVSGSDSSEEVRRASDGQLSSLRNQPRIEKKGNHSLSVKSGEKTDSLGGGSGKMTGSKLQFMKNDSKERKAAKVVQVVKDTKITGVESKSTGKDIWEDDDDVLVNAVTAFEKDCSSTQGQMKEGVATCLAEEMVWDGIDWEGDDELFLSIDC